jgi:hypothetical protein
VSAWIGKERIDRLRAVPLPTVLRLCSAQPDRSDPHKWHTARGVLSINGAKFMNWTLGVGGGGAIDLVMHLHGAGFQQALQWLQNHFGGPLPPPSPPSPRSPDLRLPPRQPCHLQRLRNYLIIQRALPASSIDRLIRSGNLYADDRANAVFLLLGKENQPVGAELRGTGPIAWRGMAPGSKKDSGFLSVPSALALSSAPATAPPPIILCESAIDALSCLVFYPDHRCISTAGARPDPPWLVDLIATGAPVFCGFDADATGDAMAQQMIARHPSVQRLRPTRNDWNETLRLMA